MNPARDYDNDRSESEMACQYSNSRVPGSSCAAYDIKLSNAIAKQNAIGKLNTIGKPNRVFSISAPTVFSTVIAQKAKPLLLCDVI